MGYTIMELIWLLLIYSFLGWLGETIVGSIKRKHFVNRGFSSGPFCFLYGFSAIIMMIAFNELKDEIVFLFFGCAILATMLEWFAGKTLERLNQHKWWDYSNKKFNFDGYICLSYSILWGILGTFTVKYGDHDFISLFYLIPETVRTVFIIIVTAAILLDLSASLAAVFHIRNTIPVAVTWNKKLSHITQRFSLAIVRHIEKRMEKAYPAIFETREEQRQKVKFAEGCGFYKLFWLFLIGAVLGDIVETLFCRITMGRWMSRSSLVWGSFSIVWGLAIAAATALLYKDREKPDRHIFLIGTLLGGMYEYLCSVFTDIVFGKIFWDYSKIPFNLGGRINLLFCFFWGIAAVVWIKGLYPGFSRWIEKIPTVLGTILTWIFVLFMIVNIFVSVSALIRYDERAKSLPPANRFEELLDRHFDDTTMKRIYPNGKPA